jgi:hypothetical protein
MQYKKTTLVLLFVLLVVILIASLLHSTLFKIREVFNNTYKYSLSLLVICKNEGMVINEYIQHYKWQGVEHIYLIDNDSTDNMKEVLMPYINQGYVSYYFLPERHKQIDHYNTIYNEIKNETKWLIVCDADEYIYNKQKNDTILTYLNTLEDTINAVELPWKMFGSSGHIKHPDSIRNSFTWRSNKYWGDENVKSIINTKNTYLLDIHKHKYIENTVTIKNPDSLNINHYPIMSEEYFRKIKMPRGEVSAEVSFQNIRDMKYFNLYDFKDVQDEELKNLLA